jgi:putative transposase
MPVARVRTAVRTILRLTGDLTRFAVEALGLRAQLSAENLSLRKQLAPYVERQVKPRRADDATRMTLVALSWFIDWRRVLTVVKPDTLIRWHRRGFQLLWRWKSRPPWATSTAGRPATPDLGDGVGESNVGREADCL